MRPPELAAIRPHLEQAVGDIDYYLTGLEEREKAERELFELYDLMVADKTPPEVKGRGKHRLTKTQYNALVHGTSVYGNPLTDEKREAILARLGPGEPLSDEGGKPLSSGRGAAGGNLHIRLQSGCETRERLLRRMGSTWRCAGCPTN